MIDITSQDLDIMETFARRVRLLSADQGRRVWWPRQSLDHHAQTRLSRLVEARFLEERVVNVHVPPELCKPLAAWRPGMSSPNPLPLSKAARKRWQGAAVPTRLYMPSRKTANLFGSMTAGLPELDHRDHCLLLAEVYVLYRTMRPNLAQRWVGEGALPTSQRDIRGPVAFLVDDRGGPACAVKPAGRYVPRQIETFHTHCAENGLPYELW